MLSCHAWTLGQLFNTREHNDQFVRSISGCCSQDIFHLKFIRLFLLMNHHLLWSSLIIVIKFNQHLSSLLADESSISCPSPWLPNHHEVADILVMPAVGTRGFTCGKAPAGVVTSFLTTGWCLQTFGLFLTIAKDDYHIENMFSGMGQLTNQLDHFWQLWSII